MVYREGVAMTSQTVSTRYAYETPRWIAINHPEFGWIVVADVTLYSTPWEVIACDTEAELREALGDRWTEQL